MATPFFVIFFTFLVGIWRAANLLEKSLRVLCLDIYANCERYLVDAVEQSLITKEVLIVKGEYGTKVGVSLFLMEIRACMRVFKLMCEQLNRT